MLYLIATPIGNLEDITLRALNILKSVDFVLCEDTRVASGLLNHFNIKKPFISFHQHSEAKKFQKVKELLERGSDLAFISDAGTPGISDPGGQLVEYISKKIPDMKISPIPGASALIAGLSVCGFSTDNFVFLGFPPHKKSRQKFFKKLAGYDCAVALFEAKYRIVKTLEEILEYAGNREMMVGRELTKMHETIYRGKISEIIEEIKKTTPKGEYVIVLQRRASHSENCG